MTTWDPANKDASITLSNGNLTATSSFAGWRSVISTGPGKTSGKWYARLKVNLAGTDFCGLAWCSSTELTSNLLGNDANGWLGYVQPTGGSNVWHNGANTTTFPGLSTTGDYVVAALDENNGGAWFTVMTAAGALNTNWNNTSANPATNTGGIPVTPGMALQLGASFLESGDNAILDTTTVISDATLSGFQPYDGIPAPVVMLIRPDGAYATGLTGNSVPFSLEGGVYSFSAIVSGGGTIGLQQLGPDSVTWLNCFSALSANGQVVPLFLPAGTYQFAGGVGTYWVRVQRTNHLW